MDNITKKNIEYIRDQIKRKQEDGYLPNTLPYQATNLLVKNCVNDMDNFPYNRSFRGIYYKSNPVVLEREAGWREKHEDCYEPQYLVENDHPINCFEGPCSVVYPCYPSYTKKYVDQSELEVMLNRKCVINSP